MCARVCTNSTRTSIGELILVEEGGGGRLLLETLWIRCNSILIRDLFKKCYIFYIPTNLRVANILVIVFRGEFSLRG